MRQSTPNHWINTKGSSQLNHSWQVQESCFLCGSARSSRAPPNQDLAKESCQTRCAQRKGHTLWPQGLSKDSSKKPSIHSIRRSRQISEVHFTVVLKRGTWWAGLATWRPLLQKLSLVVSQNWCALLYRVWLDSFYDKFKASVMEKWWNTVCSAMLC